MKYKRGLRKYNINVFLFIFPFLIIIGKMIRWTLMKNVLVDEGIGHTFIRYMENNNYHFSLLSADSVMDTAGNATYLFSLLGKLFNIPTTYIAYEVLITILWNILILYIIYKNRRSYTNKQLLFLSLSVIVLNIFVFCLAKEPIQFIYFLFIYYIINSNKYKDKTKYILTVLVLLLSVLTFRTYYLLVIVFFVYISILCDKIIFKNKKISFLKFMLILFSISALYFILLNSIKMISPSSFNELIRIRLRTSSAVSDIRTIFKSDNLLLFSLDYLIVIIRILFPLELLRLGPKYFSYVLYQLIITYLTYNKVKSVKFNSRKTNLALYVYLGFLCASAIFEPDFGSWVRHETVLFPIFMIYTFNDNKEDIINDKSRTN